MIQQYRLVGTGGFEEIAYVVGKTVTSSLSQAFPIKSFQGQESFKRESIYVYIQLSHIVVQQRLIIKQLYSSEKIKKIYFENT